MKSEKVQYDAEHQSVRISHRELFHLSFPISAESKISNSSFSPGLPEFRILPDFRHFALQIGTYRYYSKNELFLGGGRQSSAVKDN